MALEAVYRNWLKGLWICTIPSMATLLIKFLLCPTTPWWLVFLPVILYICLTGIFAIFILWVISTMWG